MDDRGKDLQTARESFRSWLVRAELRMEDGWDVGMRLNSLKSKLEPSELVKLNQIIQLMDIQGTPGSWQAIRERALQIFPGAIYPGTAEFKLLAQDQGEGEPFGIWVDKVIRPLHRAGWGDTPARLAGRGSL